MTNLLMITIFTFSVVIITDGPSDRDSHRTLPEAELSKNAGITIIVIGIGNQVDQAEIFGIASRK